MPTVNKPLPCPFCGTKVRMKGEAIIHPRRKCFLYFMMIEPGYRDVLDQKAFLAAWNRRQ